MFQFGRLPLPILYIQIRVTRHDPGRVSPFGNPRFKAEGQLPEAYRSLLRPLSVICVKAFVVCAYVTFYVTQAYAYALCYMTSFWLTPKTVF